MNITPSTIYWATRFDCICGLLFVIGILSTIAGISTVYAFFSLVEEPHDKTARILTKLSPLTFALLVISWLAFVFVPTTRQFAAMYVIPAVANNEKVQDCGNRLYDLAIEWMDELKPTKKETK